MLPPKTAAAAAPHSASDRRRGDQAGGSIGAERNFDTREKQRLDRAAQLSLFGDAVSRSPADPLIDLVVTLPDLCKCGAAEAAIGAGRGPHLASLRCTACDAHRGWLGHQTHSFLTRIVNQFGRPPEPIAIRRARDFGFISSPDLTILPPNAVAKTDDRAPLAIDTVDVEAEANSNGDETCR